jgi:hypothetical protein
VTQYITKAKLVDSFGAAVLQSSRRGGLGKAVTTFRIATGGKSALRAGRSDR